MGADMWLVWVTGCDLSVINPGKNGILLYKTSGTLNDSDFTEANKRIDLFRRSG
jgi:hypothetical protein